MHLLLQHRRIQTLACIANADSRVLGSPIIKGYGDNFDRTDIDYKIQFKEVTRRAKQDPLWKQILLFLPRLIERLFIYIGWTFEIAANISDLETEMADALRDEVSRLKSRAEGETNEESKLGYYYLRKRYQNIIEKHLSFGGISHTTLLVALTPIALFMFNIGLGGLLANDYFPGFASSNAGWLVTHFYHIVAWLFTRVAELTVPGLWLTLIAGVLLFTVPLREFLQPGSYRELMSWVRRDVNLNQKNDFGDMLMDLFPTVRRFTTNRHAGKSVWDALFNGAEKSSGETHPAAITAETVKSATNLFVWIISILELIKMGLERIAELADDTLLGGRDSVDESEPLASVLKTGIHYFFIALEWLPKLLEPLGNIPYLTVRFILGTALVIAGAISEIISLISTGFLMTLGVLISTGPKGVGDGLQKQWDNSLLLLKSYGGRLYDSIIPEPDFDPTHDNYDSYTELNTFSILTDFERTNGEQPKKGEQRQPWFIKHNPHYKWIFDEPKPEQQSRFSGSSAYIPLR